MNIHQVALFINFTFLLEEAEAREGQGKGQRGKDLTFLQDWKNNQQTQVKIIIQVSEGTVLDSFCPKATKNTLVWRHLHWEVKNNSFSNSVHFAQVSRFAKWRWKFLDQFRMFLFRTDNNSDGDQKESMSGLERQHSK